MVGLAACAAAPRWHDDITAALRQARAGQRELVVFFALPGREASDRMQQSLTDDRVLAALGDGGFLAAIADGSVRQHLYATWIGGGEGMGIAVLDGDGRCFAARPGPMDPPEFAAFLRLCARSRPAPCAWRGVPVWGIGEDSRNLLPLPRRPFRVVVNGRIGSQKARRR